MMTMMMMMIGAFAVLAALAKDSRKMSKTDTLRWLADVSGRSGGDRVDVLKVRPGQELMVEWTRAAIVQDTNELALRGFSLPLWAMDRPGCILIDEGASVKDGVSAPSTLVTQGVWRQMAEVLRRLREEDRINATIEKDSKLPKEANERVVWFEANEVDSFYVTFARDTEGHDGTEMTARYQIRDVGVVDVPDEASAGGAA